MKKFIKVITIFLATITITSYVFGKGIEIYSLTVEVKALRNSKGVVQFALYNQDGSIPDADYKKYFKILKGKIENDSSSVTFDNLPSGKYAVNVLHDENNDGKIKKGLILPVEGIGFSNYQSISLKNKPNFLKSSFDIKENKTINVKVIYM